MEGKKIVVCGSMEFVDKMFEWKKKLEDIGYEVYIPTPTNFKRIRDEEGDLERFEQIKRRETKNHFEKIKLGDILLILNYDKNGRKNYIGGNTFAEIVYGIALNYCHGHNKKIYTINPLPEDSLYNEELKAWGIKHLSNIEELV